jgi:hypothetical protein
MAEIVIWSAPANTWTSLPADEITWLDRALMSNGRDRTLHRAPRCPGLRYVDHGWELFSRDPTHNVFVAPFVAGPSQGADDVRRTARFVLPPAKGALEARPARLDAGAWIISVGSRVLPVCVDVSTTTHDSPWLVPRDELTVTHEHEPDGRPDGRPEATAPVAGATGAVASYFAHSPVARLAMAYYYQDFIEGKTAPHPLPITDVAIALDLSSESSVSEYKKELQRRIWGEQGHQRDLSRFLLVNELITMADLHRARQLATENQACGKSALASERIKYRQRKSRRPA